VKALKSAESDDAKTNISSAISKLAGDEDGCRTLILGGAFEAVSEALKSAESDDAKAEISSAIRKLAFNDDSRRALIAGGACEAVAKKPKL
jgi:hypothetical protein